MAAVRPCGTGAVLGGLAAAYLLGLLKGKAPDPEVTAPVKRRVPGLKTRRGRLRRDETTIWRGIPVTNVARTLVDVAPCLPGDDLARAFHEANVRYGTRPDQVEAVLARRPNSPGAAKLRAVLRGEVRVTQSKLERRVLELFRAHGFELPETNCPAGNYRVDCRWPEHRLTIEIDSYTYHRTSHAWEQDRRREREAYARGDDVRRYTRADVEHPRQMLEELRELLL
jgi:very-short-patch-repair endonuclease